MPAPEQPTGAVAPSAPAPLPPLAVAMTRGFEGPDGMRVDVIELEDAAALIRVSGLGSDLGDAVLSYEIRENGRDTTYTTQWHGRSWNVVVRRGARHGGESSWHSYVPGSAQRDGYRLKYSDTLSKQVDVDGIHRAHVDQKASGRLGQLQRFDRAAEQAKEDTSLQAQAARTSEACGTQVSAEIKWPTVTDELLLSKSVSGYCQSALTALRNACRYQSGRDFVQGGVRTVSCGLDGTGSMALADGRLDWAINFELYNLDQKAKEQLLLLPGPSMASLGGWIEAEQTAVCVDEGQKHFVIVGPREAAHGGMAYGKPGQLVKVPQPNMLPAGWFFEPRLFNETNNASFRGYDLRYHSLVEVDPKDPANPCTLTCGARKVALTQLPLDARVELLAAMTFSASPQTREPYALARDRRGNYYFVDRGATPQTVKDFRLYRGKRGHLRKLAMRDVVSDSEGEIFASRGGKLRLVIDQARAQWITSGRTNALQRLPLKENLGLIYNELGVYLGQQLGVPCDDL